MSNLQTWRTLEVKTGQRADCEEFARSYLSDNHQGHYPWFSVTVWYAEWSVWCNFPWILNFGPVKMTIIPPCCKGSSLCCSLTRGTHHDCRLSICRLSISKWNLCYFLFHLKFIAFKLQSASLSYNTPVWNMCAFCPRCVPKNPFCSQKLVCLVFCFFFSHLLSTFLFNIWPWRFSLHSPGCFLGFFSALLSTIFNPSPGSHLTTQFVLRNIFQVCYCPVTKFLLDLAKMY